MSKHTTVRAVTPEDTAAITAIYNHYIQTSLATFEEQPVTTEDMAQRIATCSANGYPWLVAVSQGVITGYAYAGVWKARSAYRFTSEITVYLHPQYYRTGNGTALYSALFEALRATPVRTVIAVITLPNEASVALHEKFAMHKVAHFAQVGFKFNQWQDVGYWQGAL
ncbi:GNAT family N-acetyltransferase [Salinimonas sediminis]|uniref:N-acetyltransferase n=1 Tax=Salinimonas sediminis TaxID=2303538 RepID=A0A346NIC7_9ALTE|nr:GNAT family N-acetyltransferase [Salinimonas sediminis]AXR05284.1 N-acetyltransferase [Salinimonas sediminis]